MALVLVGALVRRDGALTVFRAETRVRYADAEEARLARDALVRTGARDDVPFVIQQTLALLEISVLFRTP